MLHVIISGTIVFNSDDGSYTHRIYDGEFDRYIYHDYPYGWDEKSIEKTFIKYVMEYDEIFNGIVVIIDDDDNDVYTETVEWTRERPLDSLWC